MNTTKLAIDAIGWVGAIVLLLAYGALSFRRIGAADLVVSGRERSGQRLFSAEHALLSRVSFGVCESDLDCDRAHGRNEN